MDFATVIALTLVLVTCAPAEEPLAVAEVWSVDRPFASASISGVGGGGGNGGNGGCLAVLASRASLASIFGGAVGGCFCGGEGCRSCDGAAFAGGGVAGVLGIGTNGHLLGGGGPGGPGKTVSTVSAGNGGGGGGGATVPPVGCTVRGGGGGSTLRTVGAGGGGIIAESSWRRVGVHVAAAFGGAVTAV